MDVCEAFLNTYKELEEVLCTKYSQKSATVYRYAAEEGSKYAEELELFREMRNLLSHHANVNGEPPILPSNGSLEKLKEILEFAKNPPIALSAATPAKDLCTATVSTCAKELISLMEERGYSHIPVLNSNGVMTGVFSVGTLFAFSKAYPSRSIDGVCLSDIKELLPPHSHTTEKFVFCTSDASLYELKNHFAYTGPSHRRVAAIFVTTNGKESGRLLGMITPWDLIRAEGDKTSEQ